MLPVSPSTQTPEKRPPWAPCCRASRGLPEPWGRGGRCRLEQGSLPCVSHPVGPPADAPHRVLKVSPDPTPGFSLSSPVSSGSRAAATRGCGGLQARPLCCVAGAGPSGRVPRHSLPWEDFPSSLRQSRHRPCSFIWPGRCPTSR